MQKINNTVGDSEERLLHRVIFNNIVNDFKGRRLPHEVKRAFPDLVC
jgi:hypothetical protein